MRAGGHYKKFFGVEKYESIKVNEQNSHVLSEMSHEKSVFLANLVNISGLFLSLVPYFCPLFDKLLAMCVLAKTVLLFAFVIISCAAFIATGSFFSIAFAFESSSLSCFSFTSNFCSFLLCF